MKKKIISEIAKIIRDTDTIAIMAHRNGDGDSFGSSCSLKLALEKAGKKVNILADSDLPDSLQFFNNYSDIRFGREYIPSDLLLVIDVSQKNNLSLPKIFESYKANKTKTIIIDHHPDGGLSKEVDLSLIDSGSCSSAELVYSVIKELNISIDKNIATLLLAGIETDTSSFQNQNTTEECLAVASDLMSRGARLSTIINKGTSAYSFGELKLLGLAIDRLKIDKKHNIAMTYLSYKDTQTYGQGTENFEAIVNYLNQIRGASMVLFLKQVKPNEIRVSLRTRDENVDVSKIAKYFGGGGHVKASGFSLTGDIVEENGNILIN